MGTMEINFRGPGDTYPYLSAIDLMSEEDTIPIVLNPKVREFPFPCESCRQVEAENGGKIWIGSKRELLKGAQVLVGATAVGGGRANSTKGV
jgi:hypothetical protein